MATEVLTFVLNEAAKYTVKSSLDWAVNHNKQNQSQEIAQQMQKMLSSQNQLSQQIGNIQKATDEIKTSLDHIMTKIGSFQSQQQAKSDFGTQVEKVTAVRDSLSKIVYKMHAGAQDNDENAIINSMVEARELGSMLNLMHDVLMKKNAEDVRTLWDNYLNWFTVKLEDPEPKNTYGVKNFNEDINTLLDAFATLHQQASVVYAYSYFFGNHKLPEPSVALTRIAGETTTHIQAWNDHIQQFYDERPAFAFLLDEARAQVAGAQALNLVLVIPSGDVLTMSSWEGQAPPGAIKLHRDWCFENQSFAFHYVSKTDRWNIMGKDAFWKSGGSPICFDSTGSPVFGNTESAWKIIPLKEKDDTTRPVEPAYRLRLGRKVKIVHETSGKAIGGQDVVYLDYVLPSSLDAASTAVAWSAELWRRRYGSHSFQAETHSFMETGFNRMATCKIALQPGSDLVLLRHYADDRTWFWEYAADSTHPFHFAALSWDLSRGRAGERDASYPGDEQKAAKGQMMFHVWDVPELAGKSEEERRQLLGPGGGLVVYREYLPKIATQGRCVANFGVRIYNTNDGNSSILFAVCGPNDQLQVLGGSANSNLNYFNAQLPWQPLIAGYDAWACSDDKSNTGLKFAVVPKNSDPRHVDIVLSR